MKHLKKFNESMSYQEVLLLAKESMMLLLDNNFEINLRHLKLSNYIAINKLGYYPNDRFLWSDVYDNIAQFVELLKDEVKILNIQIHPFKGRTIYLSPDWILNDNDKVNFELSKLPSEYILTVKIHFE